MYEFRELVIFECEGDRLARWRLIPIVWSLVLPIDHVEDQTGPQWLMRVLSGTVVQDETEG